MCNRETGILWLGSNVTGETAGGLGTSGLATVKDEVKDDLRDEDIETEGETVRRQIIAPMCLYEFWRDDVPLPYFRRKKPETVDRQQEANLFLTAQKVGMRIATSFAHTRLAIPEPDDGEDVLEPTDAFIAGVTEGNPSDGATG